MTAGYTHLNQIRFTNTVCQSSIKTGYVGASSNSLESATWEEDWAWCYVGELAPVELLPTSSFRLPAEKDLLWEHHETYQYHSVQSALRRTQPTELKDFTT